MKISVFKAFEGVKTEPGDKVTNLKDAMAGIVKDAYKGVIINGPLCIAAAVVPKMWPNYSYVFAVQWMLIQFIIVSSNKIFGGGEKKKHAKVGATGVTTMVRDSKDTSKESGVSSVESS